MRRIVPLLAALVAAWGVWTYGSKLDVVYPVRDWLFWRIALLWLYNIVLCAACTSFGFVFVSRLVRERPPPLEMFLHSMAAGLVWFVLFLYAGGALGWFHLWFAITLAVLMIAAGAPSLWRYSRQVIGEWRAASIPRKPVGRAIGVGAAIFGIIGVTLVYLPLLTPESINFDAAWCHLTTSQDYALHGRIVPFVGDYVRNVPQLASFVHTWGWLLPVPYLTQRWTMPLHTEFMVFLWTLVGVAAMTRWLLDDNSVRGTWAAFFLFPSIFVYDNNLGGAADHFLAFFAIPMFLAAVRAIRRFDKGWCALLGLFAAGALLTKYQAVYLVVGMGLVVALGWLWHAVRRLRERSAKDGDAGGEPPASWRTLVTGVLLIAGVGALASSPHFLKNWIFYRDPIYPFGQTFFTHATPATPHAAYYVEHLLKDWNWRPHGSLLHKLKTSLEVFGTFSFKPHYSFSRNWPCFGGLFTFSLPLLLFARKPGRLWLGALASSAGVMTWALTFRVDRNLQCLVPLLAATTIAILIRTWQLGWTARVAIVPLVALQLIWGGDSMFYSQQGRLEAAMKYITSGYAGHTRGERFEYRRAFREINDALPPGSRVILHNLRRSLGIKHEVWLDMPGQQGEVLYEGLRGPRELYDYYKRLHVTHLLHMPGARAAWSKHDDILFNALVYRYGVNKHRFGGYQLVELPKRPPPPDKLPWNVLAFGLRGYRNGLYRVEKMQVYEGLPPQFKHFPPPDVPLPRTADGIRTLFDRAAAVCDSPRYRMSALERQLLSRDFVLIARYRDHWIYLRRHP